MTLDCPGCRSKLKLDPAKLPPGATTAVCPKCRTKILLPGGAGEITVQCATCSARLKVQVAKLRATASRSKCPKCGGAVDLPAAPSSQPQRDSRGSRQQQPPAGSGRPGAGLDQSAMTRRLDAREMGVLMGGEGGAPQRGSQGGPIPPIDDLPPADAFRSSSADLGALIDEKVDALGTGPARSPSPPPRMGEPSVEDMPFEMPATAGEGFRGLGPPPPSRSQQPGPPGAPARIEVPAPPRSSSASGSSAAPTFSSVMALDAHAPKGGSKMLPFILGGVFGGSVVAAAIILAGQFLPEGIAPAAPAFLVQMAQGASLGLLVAMILLSAVSGLLAGIALPPESEGGGGVSIFRCTVAAALVGLLAGAGISLQQGGSDMATMAVPTASWTVSLILCGLLTGIIARMFASR